MKLILGCLTAFVVSYLVKGEEFVSHLPGYEKSLHSKWFSGYINVSIEEKSGVTLSYHYILIESEGNPKEDPLIVWSNGGPGASSLWGLFTEIGPLWLSSESLKTEDYKRTGIPTLFRNEFAWTKLGNVLILSGPPPVSFGYCDPPGPKGSGYDCGSWNDKTTAKANYEFLEKFLGVHPHYQNVDMFLTGESYAGIYLPMLANEIMMKSRETSLSRRVLKGMAVGDGCVGTDISCTLKKEPTVLQIMFNLKFLYGHGQVSTKVYELVQQTCKNEFESRMTQASTQAFSRDRHSASHLLGANHSLVSLSQECQAALNSLHSQVGFYFPYGLYDECWDDSNLPNSYWSPKSSFSRRRLLQDYPCGGGAALDQWINSRAVRDALHIKPDSFFFSGDNAVGLDYELTERNLLPVHKHFALGTDLRVLIYNGDTDPGLNSFLGEWWTSSLGLIEKESWRPWTLDGKSKVVGYVTRYEGAFDYLTIRGSGHMVPQMKPAAAFEMLKQWIDKKGWKKYTK